MNSTLTVDWWGYEIAVAILLLSSLIIDTEGQNAVIARYQGEEFFLSNLTSIGSRGDIH